MDYSRPAADAAQKKKNCPENDIGIAGGHVLKARKNDYLARFALRGKAISNKKRFFKQNKIGIISQILLVLSKKGIGRIMDGKIIFSSSRVECSRSE